MTLAAIYCRVSTAEQAESGYSLPTQLDACLQCAHALGYEVPAEYRFLEDYSGVSLSRPQLTALRELMRQRRIQALVIYDLDRLSRKLAHQLLLDEEIAHAGVRLHVVTTPQQDKSPEGQLLANVKGIIAEYERTKILERTRRGREGRAKAGHTPYGRRTYGYQYIKDHVGAHYEVDPDESAVVQRIFALYLGGMSQEGIAERLTAEGVPTPPTGHRRYHASFWHQSAIRRILANETYAGTKFDNKTRNAPGKGNPDRKTRHEHRPREEWVSVPVPALIDPSTWQAVQALRPQRRNNSPRNRKHEYLLINGRLRCGQCGRSMSPETLPSGKVRYRCGSAQRHYREIIGPHTVRSVMGDQVEPVVWQAVLRVLNDPELIAAELIRHQGDVASLQASADRDRTHYERHLSRLDREARKLWEAYVNDAITVETFKARTAEVETAKAHIAAELATMDATVQQRQASIATIAGLRDYCASVRERLQRFTPEEQRLAVEALDVRVTWTPGEPLAMTGAIPLVTESCLPRCTAFH
jgi:site-specific DNA recombinase